MRNGKPLFLLFLFALIPLGIGAQQLNGEFGFGAGLGFNSNDGPLSRNDIGPRLRFVIQAGLNNRFNEHWGLALDLSTSFSVPQNVLTFTTDNTMLEDGTEIVSPLRIKSSIVAIKPNYTFDYKGFTPYIAVGIGYNIIASRLDFNTNSEEHRKTTSSLSIIPEVGLGIGEFSVSIKSVIGGRIDGFDAMNSDGTEAIVLENRYLLFYVTGNYRFSISKNNRNKFF